MYIVLEYYLLENFIINLLILYLTKTITKSKTRTKNLILGAIISSLYSLTVFYPSLLFLSSFYMKILLSGVIVIVTFKSNSVKRFFYQLIGFYIISFILAGAIIGVSFNFTSLYSLLGEKVGIFDFFKLKYLIIGLFISGLGAYKIFDYYDSRSIQGNFLAEIDIYYKNKNKKTKALLDTGNTLVDPLFNQPVIVIEYREIEDFLPRRLQEVYENENLDDYLVLEEVLRELKGEISLHIIPFKSIGKSSGILLGFKPDYLIIEFNDKEPSLEKDIIIGIFYGRISDDSSYRGLLNYKAILQEELV